jgi:hypothetical protein
LSVCWSRPRACKCAGVAARSSSAVKLRRERAMSWLSSGLLTCCDRRDFETRDDKRETPNFPPGTARTRPGRSCA